jgi:two-component system cell cycle sensor histidine kinase/response regulator CckA
VEDADDLRRVTTRVLERYGYTVIGMTDGEEALAAITAGEASAELIISDVVMPHAGGIELLHALRAAGVATRVLLTSGYTAREVRERLAVDPAVPFIAKPWTVEELLRKVREALDAPAGSAATA